MENKSSGKVENCVTMNCFRVEQHSTTIKMPLEIECNVCSNNLSEESLSGMTGSRSKFSQQINMIRFSWKQ